MGSVSLALELRRSFLTKARGRQNNTGAMRSINSIST